MESSEEEDDFPSIESVTPQSKIYTIYQSNTEKASAKYMHNTLENSSMGISNLIGPVEQMAMANHPVRGLYFFVAGSPQSLVTTAISYMEKVWICMGMEKGFMDSYKLKACIQDAFDMLFKATV